MNENARGWKVADWKCQSCISDHLVVEWMETQFEILRIPPCCLKFETNKNTGLHHQRLVNLKLKMLKWDSQQLTKQQVNDHILEGIITFWGKAHQCRLNYHFLGKLATFGGWIITFRGRLSPFLHHINSTKKSLHGPENAWKMPSLGHCSLLQLVDKYVAWTRMNILS